MGIEKIRMACCDGADCTAQNIVIKSNPDRLPIGWEWVHLEYERTGKTSRMVRRTRATTSFTFNPKLLCPACLTKYPKGENLHAKIT